MEETKREFTGVWIPRHIIEDTRLKPAARLIYAEISCFNVCTMSNETLSNRAGCSEATAKRMVSQLKSLGYIQQIGFDGRVRKLTSLKDQPIPPAQNDQAGSNKMTELEVQNDPQDNSIENNIDNSNSTNVELAKPVIKPTDTIVEASDGTRVMINGRQNPDIEASFIHWQQIVGYPISSNTKKNRFAVSNLVKKHGLDGVKGLIRGVAKSQQDQYAPRISDFVELQAKLSQLLAWGRRSTTNSGGVRIIGVKK